MTSALRIVDTSFKAFMSAVFPDIDDLELYNKIKLVFYAGGIEVLEGAVQAMAVCAPTCNVLEDVRSEIREYTDAGIGEL
jgi:hypothetical protein